MIAEVLHFALKRRLAVILMTLALAGCGIWAFRMLKIEAYPDISETQVIVITLVPGQAAEEIEQQVTVPIERALQSIPKAASRRSRTIFGLSVVDITFDYGVDDFFARQAVLEKLRDIELPDGIAPTLAPPTTPAGELYRYIVEGDGKDEIERREIQDWVIAPRLLQVPGVGDVFAFGGLVKQYQIEVDPLALARYGLTIRQVADAVDANNLNSGGAQVGNGQQSLVVRGVGMLRSVADIERVVVAAVEGVPVFMRDIGTVGIGAAQRTGIFGIDGRLGMVEGVVAMRRGENPSEILRGVRTAVEELNRSLPEGFRIAPIYDRTQLVGHTLHTVSQTLVEGFLIVLGILLLFLGSLPAALMAAATIPLSLLFAFVCMRATGIPANLLSLGALDFGIIIDGTLVMVVHMMRTLGDLQAGGKPWRPLEAVREAAGAMEKPVFVSALIIIAAYIPLFGLERVERRLFTPMAYTVCYALIGALLLTMTLVPVLATYVLAGRARSRPNKIFLWFAPRYDRLVRTAIRKATVVALAMLVITIGALWLGTRLGSEFLPQLDEGVIWIRAALAPGTAIEESAETAALVSGLIRQSPEIAFVSSQTGRQDSNTEPFGPNRNELLVGLKPYSTWARGLSKAALVKELEARLRTHVPGVRFSFTQPIIDMVTEAVTGSSADLAVIFTGPDLQALRRLGSEALDIVQGIPGAADTAIEQDPDQAQLHITLDRDSLALFGLNVADVQDVIELAVGGRAASTMYEGDRRFDITVRYVADARKDANTIGDILVATADGSRIPLSQLAAISVDDGASIITRRENRRQISVRTNIRGRDQGRFVAEAQRAIAAAIRLPEGYRIEWGGQFENLARASRRLKIIIPLTLFLMFGILFVAFESAVDAALILLNVPFAMIGGVVALLVRGIPFSISAAVGFVSVFGVAIMTGVLFIAEVNRLRTEVGAPIEEAVAGAARARMTTNFLLILVALLGMAPAAMATGIGSDIQRPMATVIIGGLISTLILALVAMPSFYYLASRKRAPSKALLPIH
ncbi:MAG: efflux RND transporter permease subunit [Candidatus Aminicenantes bacterium]|nr:MAG: efflux RND transporter permease subunit [Candidatus Aminicenantes bacterium]